MLCMKIMCVVCLSTCTACLLLAMLLLALMPSCLLTALFGNMLLPRCLVFRLWTLLPFMSCLARRSEHWMMHISLQVRLAKAIRARMPRAEARIKVEKGKASGIGKQGSPSKQIAVPAALKGLDPNKDGVPLCFDRNLAHGCKRDTWQTPAGVQCEKGLHLCMKCGSPDHGAHACSN